MRFSRLSFFLLALMGCTAMANRISVFYFNIATLNQGLSQQACEKMLSPFTFTYDNSQHYRFTRNTNPTYHNLQHLAYFPFNENTFLQLSTFTIDFKYEHKKYVVPSETTCYVNIKPFLTRCVYTSQYCRANLISVFNNPARSEPPELLLRNVPS